MLPPLNKIAAEISVALTNLKCTPHIHKTWIPKAEHYVEAMLNVKTAKDFYGIDTAEEVILGFLHIAGENWRGPQADRIRAQLREHLYNAKEYHARNQSS